MLKTALSYSRLFTPTKFSPRYSYSNLGTQRIEIFDRNKKRLQRDRAAIAPESPKADYLKDNVADALYDRLYDCNRDFSKVLELGSGSGHLAKFADPDKIENLTMCDISEKLLCRDEATEKFELKTTRVVGDEEKLPFQNNTFDCVVCNLNLHWTNDLVGSLREIVRVLKDDGFFLGAMFCDETLYQLRGSLQLGEMERKGGFAPRTAPMVRSGEVGGLLQEAGLGLLTVDVDHVTVNYPSMFELIGDLRLMGETNCTVKGVHTLNRDTLLAASGIYKSLYGNEDGTIPATFEIVYLAGWTKDSSQPKTAQRGSAGVSFKDLKNLEDSIKGKK